MHPDQPGRTGPGWGGSRAPWEWPDRPGGTRAVPGSSVVVCSWHELLEGGVEPRRAGEPRDEKPKAIAPSYGLNSSSMCISEGRSRGGACPYFRCMPVLCRDTLSSSGSTTLCSTRIERGGRPGGTHSGATMFGPVGFSRAGGPAAAPHQGVEPPCRTPPAVLSSTVATATSPRATPAEMGSWSQSPLVRQDHLPYPAVISVP